MKKQLLLRFSVIAGFAIVASVALMTCAPKTGDQPGSGSASVERGKYIVTAGACNDCHTPWTMGPQGPAPDMSRMLSGHPAGMPINAPAKVEMPWMWAGDMTMTAFSGPWGVSFAANLTPDSATGIGAWTQDMFLSTIKNGKHVGTGRPILPPMPWESFKNFSDNDLASIYLYLMTIPKISNKVQEPIAGTMPPGAGLNGQTPPPTGPMVPAYPGGPPVPVPPKK